MVTLHVFCDGSKDTYGALVDIITQHGNYTSFVLVKSDIVPCATQLWSILWKELITVIEGACIAITSQESLSLSLNVLHVYSTTVVSCIIEPSTIPSNYIQRKLDKLIVLEKKFETVTHDYVPTEINSADIASFGMNLLRYVEDRIQLWLNSPSCLCYTEHGPQIQKIETKVLEVLNSTCKGRLAIHQNGDKAIHQNHLRLPVRHTW